MAGDTKSIVAAVAEVKDLKDAIADLKKEIDSALDSLNNFGRVGSLSVRNLGSEARSLQSTFRDISRDWRRLTTPAGTVGAATTSQALGTLTRGGGGGGGYSPGRMDMGAGMGIAGGVGKGVGMAGSLFSQLFGGLIGMKWPKLGKAIGIGGQALSRGAALVSSMGVQAGIGFLENAGNRRMGLERLGRGYAGWERMLPTPLGNNTGIGGTGAWNRRATGGPEAFFKNAAMQRATRFGFNAEEVIQNVVPMLPLARGGKGGRQELENFVAGTMLPYSSSLGVSPGELGGFAGAMRGAGLAFKDVSNVISRVQSTAGFNNARESLGLLTAIKNSIGILVHMQGKATKEQILEGANLYQGIRKSLGYEPDVAASLVSRLHQTGLHPGGGEAGEIAMLQTMGFGMPNLGDQVNLARRMGAKNPERFGIARNNILEARLAKVSQNARQAAESQLLIARRYGGEALLPQAAALTDLTGLPMNITRDLVKAGMKGLRDEGFSKMGAAPKVAGGIGVLKESSKLINLQLSVLGKHLITIAKVMTKFKVTMLSAIAGIIKALPDMLMKALKGFVKAFESMFGVVVSQSAEMKVNFKDMLDHTQKMVALLKTDKKVTQNRPRTQDGSPYTMWA